MNTAFECADTTILAVATVGEHGVLHLKYPTPSLKPGARVLLTISQQADKNPEDLMPLRGTVLRYDDPFGAAVAPEEWEAAREC